MQSEIIDFINNQRVCVLAVEMMDGSPHGATVHFAFDQKSGVFFFETYNTYRKAEPLLKNKVTRATLVIGFDEANSKTLQLDGETRLINDQEKDLYDKVYFEKFPNKKEKSLDPKFVFFCFVPKWWRYTDWHSPSGKLIISSEDK